MASNKNGNGDNKPLFTIIVMAFAALAGWILTLEQRKADRTDAADRWTRTNHIDYSNKVDKEMDEIRRMLDRQNLRIDQCLQEQRILQQQRRTQ